MKRIWIIGISVAVLIGGAFLYLKFRGSEDFEPLIKSKLQQLVKDGSDGLYRLEFDSINVDVLESKVYLFNAELITDSSRLIVLDSLKQAPNDVFKVSLKTLVIDGIGTDDILKGNNIDLDVLYIKEPIVEVFHHKRSYNYTPPDTSSLYSRIGESIKHLAINNLYVQDVDFTYHNIQQDDKITKFKNVSMIFKDVLVDSATQYDSTRFLYSKNAGIFLKDYSITTADSLYNFKADSVALYASSHTMNISGLSLKPKGKKEDFNKKISFYKDRYDIKFESASIKNVDWYSLLSEDGFTASQVSLDNGSVEVYADHSLPASGESKVGNYPHQLLMKIKMPLSIDTIALNNIKVTYKEFNPQSGKTGLLVFDKINGAFTNITNEKENIAKDHFLTLNASSLLMGSGSLQAVFKFDLTKTATGNFSLDATLGAIDGKKLNDATMPLGLFEIKNAQIKKLTAHIQASDKRASGKVSFLYNDLKIGVLTPDENAKGKLKEKGFISFIANSFVIKKANNESGAFENASAQRNPQKSFFNLIWKTILDGITKTIK